MPAKACATRTSTACSVGNPPLNFGTEQVLTLGSEYLYESMNDPGSLRPQSYDPDIKNQELTDVGEASVKDAVIAQVEAVRVGAELSLKQLRVGPNTL